MSAAKIPSLGYAILGLLHGKPSSGYDLRKIFASTSLGTYSDSPGAIYPALQRLERQGLIRGTIEESSGLRRRQIFRLTREGLAALKHWITRPVTRDDLEHSTPEIMLRFAFSEGTAGAAASVALLESLESALQAHFPALKKEYEGLKSVAPRSGWLAFDCGIRQTECLLRWTRHAIRTYRHHKGGMS